MDLDPKEQELG